MFKIIPALEDVNGENALLYDIWEEKWDGKKMQIRMLASCTNEDVALRLLSALQKAEQSP